MTLWLSFQHSGGGYKSTRGVESELLMTHILLIFIASAMITIIALAIYKNQKKLSYIIFVFFHIQLIISYINTNLFVIFAYGRDWEYLEPLALSYLYREFSISDMVEIAIGRQFYAVLIAISYVLFGQDKFPLVLLNVFCSTLIVIITYKMAIIFNASKKIAEWAAIFVCIFPTLTVYTMHASREPIKLLFFNLALYMSMKFMSHKRIRYILCAVPAFIIASILHTIASISMIYMFAVAFISTAVAALRSSTGQRRAMLNGLILGVFGVPAIVLFIHSGVGLAKIGGSIEELGNNTLQIALTSADGDNRAGYWPASQTQSQTLFQTIGSVPLKIWLFTTKPYPTDVGTPIDVVAISVNILIIYFIWLVFRSPRELLKEHGRMPILFLLAIMFIIFAMGTNNWGTGLRHKTMLLVPCVALAAGLLSDLARRRTEKFDSAPTGRSGPNVAQDLPGQLRGGAR